MAESRLMTAEGVEQLRAELHRLETEERAKVVEAGASPDGTARFGATVTFEDERSGQSQSFRLVASHDANPSAGALSVESPIGAALNGRAVGHVVEVHTPKGVRRLRITAVS